MSIMSVAILALFVATVYNIGTIMGRYVLERLEDCFDISVCVGLGLLVLAFVGLFIWISPFHARPTAIVLLLATNAIALCLHLRSGFPKFNAFARFAFGLWVVLSLILLLLVQVPIAPLEKYVDGIYVWKNWSLPVRLQALSADLPADNVIPAFVTEYMVRHTSFVDVAPIVPGQDVSNRTIILSLIDLPFRSILTRSLETPNPYPHLDYVGTSWPDSTSLVNDKIFAGFLAVAIPSNAAIILPFAALLTMFKVGAPRSTLIAFGALSPYCLQHIIFSWPKSLAAFFIISGALIIERRMNYMLAALFVGLGFWAHPYGLVFVGCLALVLTLKLLLGAAGFPSPAWLGYEAPPLTLAMGLIVLVATLCPWYAWTSLVLHRTSDLVAQNVNLAGGLTQILSIRVANLGRLLFPSSLMTPVGEHAFIREYLTNLISAIGFAPLLFLPAALMRFVADRPFSLLWLCLIPGLMLVAAFGQFGMVPLLHGWQAVWPAFVAIGLAYVGQDMGPRFERWAIIVQGAWNTAILLLFLFEFHISM